MYVGPIENARILTGLTLCNANNLPTVPSLWPQTSTSCKKKSCIYLVRFGKFPPKISSFQSSKTTMRIYRRIPPLIAKKWAAGNRWGDGKIGLAQDNWAFYQNTSFLFCIKRAWALSTASAQQTRELSIRWGESTFPPIFILAIRSGKS